MPKIEIINLKYNYSKLFYEDYYLLFDSELRNKYKINEILNIYVKNEHSHFVKIGYTGLLALKDISTSSLQALFRTSTQLNITRQECITHLNLLYPNREHKITKDTMMFILMVDKVSKKTAEKFEKGEFSYLVVNYCFCCGNNIDHLERTWSITIKGINTIYCDRCQVCRPHCKKNFEELSQNFESRIKKITT